MDIDQDVQMDEQKTVQWPNGKGKGKAVDHTDGHDPENLPWYVFLIFLTVVNVQMCTMIYEG